MENYDQIQMNPGRIEDTLIHVLVSLVPSVCNTLYNMSHTEAKLINCIKVN